MGCGSRCAAEPIGVICGRGKRAWPRQGGQGKNWRQVSPRGPGGPGVGLWFPHKGHLGRGLRGEGSPWAWDCYQAPQQNFGAPTPRYKEKGFGDPLWGPKGVVVRKGDQKTFLKFVGPGILNILGPRGGAPGPPQRGIWGKFGSQGGDHLGGHPKGIGGALSPPRKRKKVKKTKKPKFGFPQGGGPPNKKNKPGRRGLKRGI